MKSIDLQGKSRKLPDSSSVLVDASELSVNEKALILYRHARANNLGEKSKNLLRNTAVMIVKNPSFTPERIRRFVVEVLPELTQKSKEVSQENLEFLQVEINRAIEMPTDRMRKSFNVLSEYHKLVLTLLLESENSASLETLNNMYNERSQPLSGSKEKFEDVIDELSESFVRTTELGRS